MCKFRLLRRSRQCGKSSYHNQQEGADPSAADRRNRPFWLPLHSRRGCSLEEAELVVVGSLGKLVAGII